jgi:hypothetical protein
MPRAPDQEGRETNKPSMIIRIFRALKRYRHQYERRREKRGTEHQINERMMARWTRRLGILTFVLAIIAGVTACILEKTDKTLRATLAANKLEQRPWLYITKIDFRDSSNCIEGSGLKPEFTIRNTGKFLTSATLIRADVVEAKAIEDWFRAIKGICDRPVTDWRGMFSIVPGADFDYYTAEPIDKNIREMAVPHLVGCIHYVWGDEPVHRTGFVGKIIGARSNGCMRIEKVFAIGPD